MFIAVLVTIANNTCKHSKCLLMDESIDKIDKMCCLLTVDYYSQRLKKKRNYAVCNNTDKTWGHHVK